MKYNIGDTVTVIGNDSPHHYLVIGSIGVVKEVRSTSCWILGTSQEDPSEQIMQFVSFADLTPYLTTASVEDCF